MTRGHHPKPPPESVRGFRVGDRVVTPLGRVATIVAFRRDSDYCDAVYDGWPPTLADVILNVAQLLRVQ